MVGDEERLFIGEESPNGGRLACIRKEAPYTLLAATLTPVGPVGSVIGIELIERKGWGVA